MSRLIARQGVQTFHESARRELWLEVLHNHRMQLSCCEGPPVICHGTCSLVVLQEDVRNR
eukprot:765530-Hanusia_phi.AAC.3